MNGVLKHNFTLRRFSGGAAYRQLDGVRIAHLTDQHFGRVTKEQVQKYAVELTNAQAPDLVLLTGDFVCHSHAYLDQLVDVIESIAAPVACVLGNHDHWNGASDVAHALARAGAELLSNAHTTITLKHERVQLVGVDDAYTGHADVRQATKGLRKDLPVLGLSHIAEQADELWDAGVPLVLSGHTHAGQITLAKMHELVLGKIMGHRYIHGMYGCRHQERVAGAVYVGAGVGAGVFPLRVGERSQREVAVFELGAPAGEIDEHHEDQRAHAGWFRRR